MKRKTESRERRSFTLSLGAERALSVLKDGKWHTTSELRRALQWRSPVAVKELQRRYGLRVECRPHKRSPHLPEYRLVTGSPK